MTGLLERAESVLLLIDMQEKLAPAMDEGGARVAAAARLVKTARLLSVPVIVTEHCPDRIGTTVPALAEDLQPEEVFRKTHFSSMREPGFKERLDALAPRRRIVIGGMETHVCVLQTALDLAAAGFAVAVIEDACGSRAERDRQAGLRRMRDAGLTAVTSEMVMFEWLGHADAAEFRQVHRIIKDAG